MSQREETLERLKQKAAEEEEVEEEEVEEEPVEEEKGATSIREYILITDYKIVSQVNAGSAKAAIDTLEGENGEFAAIPARNFSAFKVGTETKTVTTVTPI